MKRPERAALLDALPAGLRPALDAALEAARLSEVWAVGGAVRDLALGRPIIDLDLATTGDAAPCARAAAAVLGAGTRIEVHDHFGTASVRSAAGRLDFARTRTEQYERPGALPDPVLGATIEADLARRDFSVNAVALCLAGPRVGELLDPHRGLDDLRAHRLRVLHAGSFADDATRIWRGGRYAARLGLRPDPGTRAAIEDGSAWLGSISGERLWAEFERTACERSPGRVLALLDEWGALAATSPGLRLETVARTALARRRGPIAVPLLAAVLVAPLPSAARAAAGARFGAPREVARAVAEARALLDCTSPSPEALAALEGTTAAARTAARWLAPVAQPPLQRALGRWERTRPPLTAEELQQLGVPPGPALGEWLRRLRRERFLGTLHTRAEARRLVRDDLAQVQAKEPR